MFSNDAAAAYSTVLGREVKVEEIQPVVNELMAANILMRRGHGLYLVTDPFVQDIWREKKSWKGEGRHTVVAPLMSSTLAGFRRRRK